MSNCLWTGYLVSVMNLPFSSHAFFSLLPVFVDGITMNPLTKCKNLTSFLHLMSVFLISSQVSPHLLVPFIHLRLVSSVPLTTDFSLDFHASTFFSLSIHSAHCVHQGNHAKANPYSCVNVTNGDLLYSSGKPTQCSLVT